MSLFGQPAAKPGGLFGSLNTSTAAPTTSLFGASTAQPAAGGGLFGQPQQQQQQQPQQTNSLFGATTTQQPQQTSSLFGSTAQKPTLSLFGGSTAQPQQQQQQQQTSSLFGQQPQQQQQQQTTSLFGQPQQQQQPQQQFQGQTSTFGLPPGTQPQPTNMLSQSQAQEQFPALASASIWQPQRSQQNLRQKPFQDQVESLALRWLPDMQSPTNAFQTYFYNTVPEDQVPYYMPGPADDEKKWDEALQKKPSENSIPVLARGFRQIGERLRLQYQAAASLQQRLHQINDSLTARLSKHDTETSVAATKARHRHQVLSRRCLALATKVQVLRNRGYAMDRTEEELRLKLQELQTQAGDPVLVGKQEEIWARMTVIRDRADVLARETKGIGARLEGMEESLIDDEGMKTIRKILGDYDAQMIHLSKEVTLITKDFDEWETSTKPSSSAR